MISYADTFQLAGAAAVVATGGPANLLDRVEVGCWAGSMGGDLDALDGDLSALVDDLDAWVMISMHGW